MINLSENIKITGMAGSTGTAAPGTTFLDMSGFDACLFLLQGTSAITSTGAVIIRQTSHVASTALGYASTFGVGGGAGGIKFTAPVANGYGNIGYIDVINPLKRYLSLKALTCTGVNIIAIQYHARRKGSTEAKKEIHSTWSGVHVCTS